MTDDIGQMEPGERELRKAFEEVTTNNVKSIVSYTTKTRDMARDLEKRVEKLEARLRP